MPELNVNKEDILSFLSNVQKKEKLLIIPEYQRPYEWEEEECETLWGDLENYFDGEDYKNKENYFLGCIVIFNNGNKLEVIDGQQRITTLMLLIRAIYEYLEKEKQDEPSKITKLKGDIESCIWYIDNISGEVNKEKIIIETNVVDDETKNSFREILQKGVAENIENNRRDKELNLYKKNYNFFREKIKNFASDRKRALVLEGFILCILRNVIIFPIECNTEKTALTIFTTLNDRGKSLNDLDILKSTIYKEIKSSEERTSFKERWCRILGKCEKCKFDNNNFLFVNYMHIIRAQKGITDSEIALREFFANKYKVDVLLKKNLLDDLEDLVDFWLIIRNEKEAKKDEDSSKFLPFVSSEAKKYLQCLKYYSNYYWCYSTSVFFHYNKEKKYFPDVFEKFLKKLLSFLSLKFIYFPTSNRIKGDIYKAMVEIKDGANVKNIFSKNLDDVKDLDRKRISDSSDGNKIAKSMVLLNSYLNPKQKELIIENFEIEHILPKKWQDTNYNGWNRGDADKSINLYGNKIPLEKKTNIQAGNKYFKQKKDRYYKNSKIRDVIELSSYKYDDWLQQDIERRNEKVIDNLVKFFRENLGI